MFFVKKKEKTSIQISGIFKGTINSKGKVVIADTGICKMDIISKELDILGRLEGQVDVGVLTIYDTGVFRGSAKYRELHTMEGAHIKFEGAPYTGVYTGPYTVPDKREESAPVPNNKTVPNIQIGELEKKEKAVIFFKSSF